MFNFNKAKLEKAIEGEIDLCFCNSVGNYHSLRCRRLSSVKRSQEEGNNQMLLSYSRIQMMRVLLTMQTYR